MKTHAKPATMSANTTLGLCFPTCFAAFTMTVHSDCLFLLVEASVNRESLARFEFGKGAQFRHAAGVQTWSTNNKEQVARLTTISLQSCLKFFVCRLFLPAGGVVQLVLGFALGSDVHKGCCLLWRHVWNASNKERLEQQAFKTCFNLRRASEPAVKTQMQIPKQNWFDAKLSQREWSAIGDHKTDKSKMTHSSN